MHDLPWLLVYGRVLWVAGVVCAAVAACLLTWSEARRRGRASVAWARREFTRPPSGAALHDGARTVITGVVVAEGRCESLLDGTSAAAATARAERRPTSLKDALDRSASVRAPGLALRGDDGVPVHMDAPVAVLAGTSEAWTGCILPRLPRSVRARADAADEAGAAMLSNQHVVLATVQPGDRVQAYGRLVLRQDIRTAAPRWTLAPAGEPDAGPDDPPLAAIPWVAEGVARVAGPRWQPVARAGLLAAAGAFAATAVVGEWAILQTRAAAAGSATVVSRHGEPLEMRGFSWALLAAATPFRRGEAVRAIGREVTSDPRGARDVSMVAAVWSLGDDCQVGVEVLARHGRHPDAVSMGARCGDTASRWEAAEVAWMMGDPGRASDLLRGIAVPPDRFHGQEVSAALSHVLADRPAPAAAMLRRAAEDADGRTAAFIAASRCSAAALGVRAGDRGARDDLRARTRGEEGWRCALLLADLTQGEARLAVLRDATSQDGAPGTWAGVAALLSLEAGSEAVPREVLLSLPPPAAITLVDDPGTLLDTQVPGLERAVYDSLAARPLASLPPGVAMLRARLGLRRAAFESLFGQAGAARALAARAQTDAEDLVSAEDVQTRQDGQAEIRDAAALRVAIELRAGDLPRARALWSAMADAPTELSPLVAEPSESNGAVLALALEDDGARREVFRTSALAFGLRRLTSGQDPMREWLAWGAQPPCWRCYARFVAADLAHRGMAARSLGVPDEVRWTDRGLAGLRAALLRRDTSVVYALTEWM